MLIESARHGEYIFPSVILTPSEEGVVFAGLNEDAFPEPRVMCGAKLMLSHIPVKDIIAIENGSYRQLRKYFKPSMDVLGASTYKIQDCEASILRGERGLPDPIHVLVLEYAISESTFDLYNRRAAS